MATNNKKKSTDSPSSKKKTDASSAEFKKAREEIKELIAETGSQAKIAREADQKSHQPAKETVSRETTEPEAETRIKVTPAPPEKEQTKSNIQPPSERKTDTPGTEQTQPKPPQQVVRNFEDLYGRGASKREMGTIDRHDPNKKKKIIVWTIGILVLLAGVAVAGFYFFVNGQPTFTGDAVSIDMNAPVSVTAAEEMSIVFAVENGEAVDLKNAELTMQFPSNFSVSAVQPAAVNAAGNAWDIGTVSTNGREKITIQGSFIGTPGTAGVFTARLSYFPANFNAQFQATEEFTVLITESSLTVALDVPTKILSGKQASYSAIVTNNSSSTIYRPWLALTIPETISIISYDPAPDDADDLQWEIAELNPGSSYTVTWQGTTTGDEGVMRELAVRAGTYGSSGTAITLVEESSIIFLANPQLALTLTVSGADDEYRASFGETLEYALQYQNGSDVRINDATIQIVIDDDKGLLDWEGLTDVHNGSVESGTITWTPDEIEALAAIAPGDEGAIIFSIPVQDNTTVSADSEQAYTIISSATARSESIPDLDGDSLEVSSNTVTVLMNTRLDLRVEGRYYSDEYIPVGEGPLPPVVGEQTTYQIYWYINNNINQVTDVTVRATLPDEAAWTGVSSRSAGDLTYDSSSRTITWTINKIPSGVGQTIAELEANFAVQIEPTAADVGTAMTLLEQTTITARDSVTGTNLKTNAGLITTALPDDPLAVDKEIVQPATQTNTNTPTQSNTNSL